jgi:hypothetical protein
MLKVKLPAHLHLVLSDVEYYIHFFLVQSRLSWNSDTVDFIAFGIRVERGTRLLLATSVEIANIILYM